MAKKRKIVLGALAVIVMFCLWYARPLTIGEICPGLDLERCAGVQVYFSTYDNKDPENRVGLLPEDAAPLLELFQGRTFRRSPLWWFPGGIKTHPWREGDFKWSIDFAFRDAPVTDFSTATGYLLHFNNFFGELEMRFTGKTWPVSTVNQEQWLEDVLDFLLTLEPNGNFQLDLYN